jgi:hypothetical protein
VWHGKEGRGGSEGGKASQITQLLSLRMTKTLLPTIVMMTVTLFPVFLLCSTILRTVHVFSSLTFTTAS